MIAQIHEDEDSSFPPETLALAANTARLLADETRLHVIWSLLHGEHSVNDLAAHVGAQPAAVSQHLAKLRLARLVTTRRSGTHVYYRIENDHVRAVVEELMHHTDHVNASPR